MENDQLNHYKLVILGSGSVGKSALVLRYVCDEFLEEHDPTIEDTYRKEVTIQNEPVMLDILDTAGQEEFRSMMDAWINAGDGFLLVYDITQQSTFDEIILKEPIIRRVKKDAPILLVGNKVDLERNRAIAKSEGESTAQSWNCDFMETSAKDQTNCERAFTTLAARIKETKTPKNKTSWKLCCVI